MKNGDLTHSYVSLTEGMVNIGQQKPHQTGTIGTTKNHTKYCTK